MRSSSLVALALAAAACSRPAAPPSDAPPTTDDQKAFYALGLSIARSLGTFHLTPDELRMVQHGMSDGVTGVTPAVKFEEYGPKIQELARKRASAQSEAEKAKGKAFLEKSATEPGAQKTASGLVYFELKAGEGETPAPADTVEVNYRGTLLDGTEFDSSFKRNQPATFPLNGVIPCWTEGVQKMKVGGKAKLVCPPEIAYGERGAPPNIPGGATLIFEVDLLKITKAGAPPVPAPAPAPAPAP